MFQRRRLKIYFDGGCRPNPGALEAAVVARGATYFYDDLGYGTSSDAEWLALRLALQLAQSLGEPDFDLIGDSLEVTRQASGASRPGALFASANDPAVVGMSAVSILSFSRIGMPEIADTPRLGDVAVQTSTEWALSLARPAATTADAEG